jgi:surface polysaccharide O-acyltransferase-like enzyme
LEPVVSRPNRVGWVDYARGIAILSVVVWHVTGGLISNPDIAVGQAVQRIHANWETYALRCMPVFFLLSGVFVTRSLKKPTVDYLRDKARTLLYPYVVWSLITLILGTIAGSYANHEMTLRDAPQMLYNPVQHYWFLYALLVVSLVFMVLDRSGINRWVFLVLGAFLYVLGEATNLADVQYVAGQICLFTVYFAAGALFGQHILAMTASAKTSILLGIALILTLGSGVFLINEIDPALSWLKFVSALAILAAVVTIGELLDRSGLFREIQRWGRLSLEIYLAHVIALALARAFLLRFLHIDGMWIHLIFGTLVGLFAPIVMVLVLRRISFPYAFTFPRNKLARQGASP